MCALLALKLHLSTSDDLLKINLITKQEILLLMQGRNK